VLGERLPGLAGAEALLLCEKNKFGAGAEFAIQWINLGFSRYSPQLPDLLLDAPRHCPRCGGPLTGQAGLVVEYWVADDRVFYCWCRACDWTGTIVQVDRHIGHEADE
jgi:hypothetical protein